MCEKIRVLRSYPKAEADVLTRESSQVHGHTLDEQSKRISFHSVQDEDKDTYPYKIRTRVN